MVLYFYIRNSLFSIGEDKLLCLWHLHSVYCIKNSSLQSILKIKISLIFQRLLDVSKNLQIPHYLVCLKCYCSIQAFTQSPGNQSTVEANKCLWSVPGAFINWSWLCISSLKPVAQYCSASDKRLKISIRLYMEKNLCTQNLSIFLFLF